MKLKILDRPIFVQGYRFIVVGLVNAAIGLGVIYSSYNLFHLNYKLSNILGYGCGLINSFVWNRQWTFKSRKHPGPEILLFFIMFGISYGLNLAVTVLCVEKLGLNPNIAQLAGIIFYTSSNFFLNKYITFR